MHKPNKQICSQVLKFRGWQATFSGGKDFCFYHMFEVNTSGRNKILGGPKYWEELPPNSPRG